MRNAETTTTKKEIDLAAASATFSADPVIISKYAATVAKRSLKETEGESVRERI